MIVSRPVSAEADNVQAGILWMLLTAACFVALDATAKLLLESYPLVQIVWARFLFHLLVLAVFIGGGLRQVIRSSALGMQLVRSGLLLVTTFLFFAGVHLVPLAKASAIMFLSPILVTVLSIPLLGERVGPRRWFGVCAGFAGAMVIVRPAVGAIEIASLFLLAAALTNACYQITTRRLRVVDGPLTTLFYTAVLGAVLLSFAVPFIWVAPSLADWGLMILMGVFGAVGHLCLIRAFRAAPASAVAPFAYSNLIWATLLGYLLFGNLPDTWTLIGALIIAASGIYILYRERRVKSAAASSA